MLNFFRSISINSSNKIYLLLPLFTILTFFGPGFQSLSICTWLWFPLAIYYSRNITNWSWYLPFFLANSIGTALAFLGIMNDGTDSWSRSTFGLSFLLGLAINCIILVSLIIDRLAQSVFRGWASFMVFPCAWTGKLLLLFFLTCLKYLFLILPMYYDIALWNMIIFLPFIFLGDFTNYA